MPRQTESVPFKDADLAFRFQDSLSDQLQAGSFDVPLLPCVANQLLGLTNDERTNAGELAALIHQDQTVAGHVLKVANSVAYGGHSNIVSLQQAIARLGLDRLRQLAFAVCVQNRVFRLVSHPELVAQLWRHSMASATYAKEIARIRRANLESAFLCGLLHTIGKPVVLQAVADLEGNLKQCLEVEDVWQIVDLFYVDLGAVVVEAWALPEVVKECVLHCNSEVGATAFPAEVKTIYLAHCLACYTVGSDGWDGERIRKLAPFVDLNLYPDDVSALLEKKESVVETLDSMVL